MTGGTVASATPAVAELVDCATVPWMDPSKSADERAHALLDASSQHQKYRWLVEQPANDPTRTSWSGEVEYPAQVACTPTVIYSNGAEGAHGRSGTTAWPGPIAIAASWNLDLNELKGATHAEEAFANRSNVILGPGVASGRTPLSGRTAEYFGEDPLLSGLMGAANVRGIEDRAEKPVIANLKHYVGNEQETDRQASSSNMDERTFHQVYDLPYEIAIKESDPDSLMCSYNQINGVWACEHDILTTSLREDLGFNGYVMSDFGAVHSTAASLNAGLDQELNRPIWFTPVRLDAALDAGQITQERVDEAAFRVVRSYIAAGLFDEPLPEESDPLASTDDSRALARELAEQSAVLLKNDDGILPLHDGPITVAVIGPTASQTPTDGVSSDQACSAGGFGAGGVLDCSNVVDPLTAITERVEAVGGTVIFDDGSDLESVATTAASADVAVAFGYLRTGEFSDPADLRLDSEGDALIETVAAANDDTVVVLNSGTAVEMPWLDDVDAVFSNWFSGEQMGPALAALLYGDVNPSGKLPMTFPKSVADTPTGSDPARYPGIFSDGSTSRPAGTDEIRQVDYTEGLQVGYKWYDEQGIDPLFEFGHGLSYTEFEYSKLKVKTKTDKSGRIVTTVSFTVKNSGSRAGSEVPQVYLTLPDAADEPGKRLVGFDRIDLQAGKKAKVTVKIDSAASNHPFEIWDADADDWSIVDGTYTLSVGSSSRDLRLTDDIDIDLVDHERPQVELVSPTTAGPFSALALKVDATDNQGLKQIVANIYQDGTLVKSTQTAVSGKRRASHTANVTLPEGAYTIKYNAHDLAGNVSRTSTAPFSIDTTAPRVTIKDGASFTVATGDTFDKISVKLFDAQKVDRVTINGTVKDLSNNTWSDVNFIRPGVFGAVTGLNTLVVYDVAGNTGSMTFTLN